MIKLKRIYDDYSKNDGYRILIDRLWPRGISKERAKVNLWIKEISPSNELRRWYHDNLQKTKQFETKYKRELKDSSESLEEIKNKIRGKKTITLLYASKDPKPAHAIILQQMLKE